MIVIADTTPLITFLKINRFEILRDLYGTIHIPLSVYNELTENIVFADEAKVIKDCDFLAIHKEVNSEKVNILRRATGLDLGESEAIILADESDTKLLLIDESHGRSVAEQMGIPITGAIGVLMAAYKKRYLNAQEIKGIVEIMKSSNRFISESLYELLLSQIN